MGFLSDFAGAFSTNVGNQMQQQEEQDYQARLQEALERRRRKYQEEDELRRRKMSNEDRATQMNMSGPQIGMDDQGRQSLLRANMTVDPMTGALSGTRERIGDAPVTPTGEVERKVGDKIVRYRTFSNGQEEVVAEAPRYKANVGGADIGGADRRANESNTRRDRDALAIETERRLTDIRAEVKGLSTERPTELDADSGKEIVSGLSEFDQWLRSNGMNPGQSKAQAIESARKRIRGELAPQYGGGDAGGDAGAQESKDRPADKPKDDKPSYSELAAQVKAKRPDLTDAQIRQYLASKGITP